MKQLVVISTENHSSIKGKLYTPFFSFPVVIGKNGLTENKSEGDGKTPLGLFKINFAFGSEQPRECSLPFLTIELTHRAIDDPNSCYYNQILKEDDVTCDWKSAEVMQHPDGLYELGLVIDHNIAPTIPGKGSCIFLHLWRNATTGTEGCVAMSRENMLQLISWLDPKNEPHLLIVCQEAE